jgi:hypothetical protein
MVNMQEQIKIGFNHISRELRSLSSSRSRSSSAIPPRISEKIQYDDEDQEDQEDIDDIDDIEEINPKFDNFSDDEIIDEEAQKKFVKQHRKEIRVGFI